MLMRKMMMMFKVLLWAIAQIAEIWLGVMTWKPLTPDHSWVVDDEHGGVGDDDEHDGVDVQGHKSVHKTKDQKIIKSSRSSLQSGEQGCATPVC